MRREKSRGKSVGEERKGKERTQERRGDREDNKEEVWSREAKTTRKKTRGEDVNTK